MTTVSSLTLRSGHGILGNEGPSGDTPRQVNIGLADSLATHGVSQQGARCNIILSGQLSPDFGPGAVIRIREAVLRVTMPCEPCTYGAGMANVRTSRFRLIERYLAIVQHGGILTIGDTPSIQLGVYPSVPGDFRSRCAWALDFIPRGHVVGALDFLNAIGAGKAYARTLPRWMASAKIQGKPVHRVLTTNLTAPSWCPEARTLLTQEQTPPHLPDARFDLMRALWF